MAEYYLRKLPGGTLVPVTDQDSERLQSIRNGALVKAEITQPRNGPFLSKFICMCSYAFNFWEPDLFEEKGLVPVKDFDSFRKDVTILAGFRDAVVDIRGNVKFVAKSISFAKMEEDEFQQVYKAVFSVLWRLVLSKVPNMSEQEAHNAINQLAEFA